MAQKPNPELRNQRSRRAILEATFDLAARNGYAKLTIDAIAGAAGVGKQTIYRWWPSKGAVALDALNDKIGSATDFPDTGDIAADLIAQMSAVAAMLTGEIGVVYRGIIAEAQTDPGLAAAIRATIVEPRAELCRQRLDTAISAGQLRTDVPARTMVDLFYAPVYYRFLLGAGAPDVSQSPDLVGHILSGLRPAVDQPQH